jgi:hypothetical protein
LVQRQGSAPVTATTLDSSSVFLGFDFAF